MSKLVINDNKVRNSVMIRSGTIRLKVLFFSMVLVVFSSCSPQPEVEIVSPEPIASGGIIGSQKGPSFNPLNWNKVEGDVLAYTDDVWGRRVKPRGIFQVPGGLGLLYNSKPPADYQGDGARHQTGSLAFTTNLIDWHDYPGNPVLSEIKHEWQNNHRVMPRALLYDNKNEQWVAYLGGAHGDYVGIRAVGTAYSRDLVNWDIDKNVTFTVEDYANQVAHLTQRTAEEIIERGRVYAAWAIHHQDKYYLNISGFMFYSHEPGGPFLYDDSFIGDLIPATRPAYWEGRWYAATTGIWDGQPGIGLAVADDLKGPYYENPDNPIFNVETIVRARPQLVRHDGTWAILYCHTYDEDTDRMSLRVAISGIHPSLVISK